MAKVTATVKGVDELGARYKKIGSTLPKLTEKQMKKAVLLVHNEAKKSIQRGGGGGTVVRYGPKRDHNVSAPNSPPATDRGNLIRGLRYDVVRKIKKVWGYVRSDAKYSTALEFGTRDMTKRPFMKPALKKMRKKVVAALKKGVNDAL